MDDLEKKRNEHLEKEEKGGVPDSDIAVSPSDDDDILKKRKKLLREYDSDWSGCKTDGAGTVLSL